METTTNHEQQDYINFTDNKCCASFTKYILLCYIHKSHDAYTHVNLTALKNFKARCLKNFLLGARSTQAALSLYRNMEMQLCTVETQP